MQAQGTVTVVHDRDVGYPRVNAPGVPRESPVLKSLHGVRVNTQHPASNIKAKQLAPQYPRYILVPKRKPMLYRILREIFVVDVSIKVTILLLFATITLANVRGFWYTLNLYRYLFRSSLSALSFLAYHFVDKGATAISFVTHSISDMQTFLLLYAPLWVLSAIGFEWRHIPVYLAFFECTPAMWRMGQLYFRFALKGPRMLFAIPLAYLMMPLYRRRQIIFWKLWVFSRRFA